MPDWEPVPSAGDLEFDPVPIEIPAWFGEQSLVLGRWRALEGQFVVEGQDLLELDAVTGAAISASGTAVDADGPVASFPLEAPASGELHPEVPAGQTVQPGDRLGWIRVWTRPSRPAVDRDSETP